MPKRISWGKTVFQLFFHYGVIDCRDIATDTDFLLAS